MKIYLDACCLNRPLDDQRQPRVRLEAEAISLILQKIANRNKKLFSFALVNPVKWLEEVLK